MAGVFRLLTELSVIVSPMVLREVILFVEGKATVVPNDLWGGVGLAVSLLLLVLLKATTLQHFIHGGEKLTFQSGGRCCLLVLEPRCASCSPLVPVRLSCRRCSSRRKWAPWLEDLFWLPCAVCRV